MSIRLKHMYYSDNIEEYFYEGSLPVKDGVIEIPNDKEHWLLSVYYNGYRVDPDTGETIDYPEALARFAASQEAPQAAESDGDGTSAGSNTRTPELAD